MFIQKTNLTMEILYNKMESINFILMNVMTFSDAVFKMNQNFKFCYLNDRLHCLSPLTTFCKQFSRR